MLCLVLVAFALYKYSSIDINKIQKHVSKKIETHQIRPKQLPKPKFEFYTRLPKANSSFQYDTRKTTKAFVSANKVRVVDAKPITQHGEHYLIQVASFKKLIDADNLRASLIMQGHSASLSQFKNNTSTWYRVEIGPFTSLQKAKAEQLDLEKIKHNGLIKKIS